MATSLSVCCCAADVLDCEDLREALLHTICGFYVEVLDSLPIHECPDLLQSLFEAGHCYGLLEPISNIILHTIVHRPSNGCYTRENITDELMDKMHNSRYWLRTARRSLDGLITFLTSYYRYLTQDQAVRYLFLAQADIHFVVDLINRDFHKYREEVLPPDAWVPRVEDAVMYAAMAAEHPNPEHLVGLATTTFGADHIDRIAVWLHAVQMKLPAVAIEDIYKSLTFGGTQEGLYLYNLRVSYADVVTIGTDAAGSAGALQAPDCQNNIKCPSILKETLLHQTAVSPTCDYIKTIEALLVDDIHALHLSTISRLSPAALKMLHHGLVVAGYLYGPLKDPALNILVHAVWYQQLSLPVETGNNVCMPPDPMNMICTDRMLRNGFNALTGQVVFLCSKYGMSLSGHDAMEYLYITNCNLRAAMDLAEQAQHQEISFSSDDLSAPTEAAVKAMGHPKPAAIMALLDSFTPELEDKLCHLLPAKGHELSCADINQISRLLSSHVKIPIESPPAATMRQGALAEIAEKKRCFERKQRFLMGRVRSLLDKNYKVHIICNVARSDIHNQQIYHVNFLATRTDVDNGDSTTPLLFFAQVFCGRYCRWKQDDSKQTFCCPVTISAYLGRCFVCEFQRAKVMHPISVGMEYYGRQEKTYLDFMSYISKSPHTVYNYKMESDFVYFDPLVNTELAKYLNECAKEREELTEEEAYQALVDSIPC